MGRVKGGPVSAADIAREIRAAMSIFSESAVAEEELEPTDTKKSDINQQRGEGIRHLENALSLLERYRKLGWMRQRF